MSEQNQSESKNEHQDVVEVLRRFSQADVADVEGKKLRNFAIGILRIWEEGNNKGNETGWAKVPDETKCPINTNEGKE